MKNKEQNADKKVANDKRKTNHLRTRATNAIAITIAIAFSIAIAIAREQ